MDKLRTKGTVTVE